MNKSPSAVPDLPDWAAPAVDAAFRDLAPGSIGVAISGGSDSRALLLLALAWAQSRDRTLHAATVDHQLRPESRQEAEDVARLCQDFGVPHDILVWGEGPRGNLQASARAARRALLGDWAACHGVAAVALGHTLDDQAETLILRLMRGSGVDGLAAMETTSGTSPQWLRPLLSLRREALRDWLRGLGIGWAEDPGNHDDRFDRIRVRQCMAALELDPARLEATAGRMALAREVLSDAARTLAEDAACVSHFGAVDIRLAPLLAAREDTALRLLAGAMGAVSCSPYRPRFQRLRNLLADLRTGRLGRGRSLQGCLVRPCGDAVSIRREPSATGATVPAGEVWDNRWQTSADDVGLEVSALGHDGLTSLPDWRASGQPREILITTPAFRKNGYLVAAPCVIPVQQCRVSLVNRTENWLAALSTR